MITKQPITMTPVQNKIPNFKLKEIISDMVDAPTTEWQSDKIVSLVNGDINCELKMAYCNKHDARLLRMYGMSLYCEACKKYGAKPTDCVGKPIEGEMFKKWLNRSHKLTYHYHYREEFLKPMMYKLNKL